MVKRAGDGEFNFERSRKLEVIGRKLGMNDVLPAMGPFPLKDTQGMGITVCILILSLDKGRYHVTL